MQDTTPLEGRLLARIDALGDDAVVLLQELVRTNSVNPAFLGVDRAEVIGGETRANEILRERYDEAGLETHWVAPDPERKNLVGVRPGKGGGRSLILNGHVDTVPPVDPENWVNGSPWNPEIRDGRLYGLGSTDMKGSDTAMWLVAQALHDEGVELKGDLQLHSVVGEETMQHELGTSACVRAGFRADGAIGVNALEKGVKIVQALQDLETQWGMTKSHPSFSPGFFTIMPGVFYADPGMPLPVYFPNRAQIEYVLWYPPQEEAADVASGIEEHVLTACRLDPWLREHPPRFEWLLNWPPMETPWEHPLAQAVVRAREAASGVLLPTPSPGHPVNFGAACDGSFYEDEGIPSVVFGPGDLRIAHCKDENVSIDEVIAAAQSLAVAAMDWCGVAEEGGVT